MTEKTEEKIVKQPQEQTVPEGVAPVGGEYPDTATVGEKVLDPNEIQEWKRKHPYCKFGFFMHVDDPYVYRSYTSADVKELDAIRKQKETETGKTMTDDEYLAIFLDKYVMKPQGIREKIEKSQLSAGIPHLLFDLINHLSGFAEVEPMLL